MRKRRLRVSARKTDPQQPPTQAATSQQSLPGHAAGGGKRGWRPKAQFDAQHELDLTETALEIVGTQPDNLDTAREAANELIEALLFDAADAGVPIASLIDAFSRRFGPWCETDRRQALKGREWG
jgi:hypothetical protein